MNIPYALNSISFKSKIKDNKIDIYLIKGKSYQKILENLEKNDEIFIHAINKIKNEFEKISVNKLIVLKESLKDIISNIKKMKKQ